MIRHLNLMIRRISRRGATRVVIVANDRLPTLQICFTTPLAPDLSQGAIKIELLTEDEIKKRFPESPDSKRAETWTIRRMADFDPEIVVFCRYSGPHTEALIKWARFKKVPTIFHIDDDLLAVPRELGEGKFKFHNSPQRIEAIRFLISNVDVLYCATPILRDRLIHLRGDQLTYVGRISGPGAIIKEPKLVEQKRIGCMGIGRGHDLDPLVPVVEELLDRRPHIEFHLFGSTPKPQTWEKFGSRIVMTPLIRDYSLFRKKFADLDWSIGLAPIVDIPFNKAKTNLKWLEYTSLGIAVIASRATLYDECCADGCGLLVESPKEWLLAMEFLLDNPQERVAQVLRAQQRLRDQFSAEALRQQVLDVFDISRKSYTLLPSTQVSGASEQ